MNLKIKYNRGRFPIQPESGQCRGCHGPLPKNRRSWCSDLCYNTFEPSRVRLHCKKRDKAICHLCGTDTERVRRRAVHAIQFKGANQHHYMVNGVYYREEYNRARAIALKHAGRWWMAAKKRLETMRSLGWPQNTARDWWEMDHIIPFSEGGVTVLENVRTLCVVCHKKRTKQWHKDRQ